MRDLSTASCITKEKDLHTSSLRLLEILEYNFMPVKGREGPGNYRIIDTLCCPDRNRKFMARSCVEGLKIDPDTSPYRYEWRISFER